MLEEFRRDILSKPTIAKSLGKSHFEFFEVFFFRIIPNLTFQLAQIKVVDRVSLMEKTKRDVHKLVCLFLMNRD